MRTTKARRQPLPPWVTCEDCHYYHPVPYAFRDGWALCEKYGHETFHEGGCVWGAPLAKPLKVSP